MSPLHTPLDVGDPAPDFTLSGGAGRRLSDLRGSPVVLAFHAATWDPTRAEQVEAYNRLIERLPGLAGTRLLSISGDGPWRELTFADESLALPVVSGDTAALARLYGVEHGSAVFVVDGDGIVRWRHASHDSALPHPDDLARALTATAAEAAAERATADERDDAPRTQWTRRDFVATALGASIAIALTAIGARADGVARATHAGVDDA